MFAEEERSMFIAMNRFKVNAPSQASLADHLARHPDVIVEHFAQDRGVTPKEVVHALPEDLRRFADGAHFIDVMSDVAGWGNVTLIVHTDDGIMEFGGPIPAGQVSRGYYNIPDQMQAFRGLADRLSK
jgi:putative heme utilization carrier protein HutX